jgi:hypothetical protein
MPKEKTLSYFIKKKRFGAEIANEIQKYLWSNIRRAFDDTELQKYTNYTELYQLAKSLFRIDKETFKPLLGEILVVRKLVG